VEYALLLIPIAFAIGFGVIGWKTALRRAGGRFGGALALAMLANLGLWVATLQAQGWDGLGYMLLMVGTSLPATAGLLLGGGFGLAFRGRLSIPS